MTKTPKTIDGFRNSILLNITAEVRRNGLPPGNTLRIASKKLWPEYNSAQNTFFCPSESIDLFHSALESLESEGLVSISRNKKLGIFTNVIVSYSQASRIFQVLNIGMMEDVFYNNLALEMSCYCSSSCVALCAIASDSPMSFVKNECVYSSGSPEELQAQTKHLHEICRCAEAAWGNQSDVLERNFSIQMGLGSKGFALIKNRVARLLEPAAFEDKVSVNEILKKYHILQNPPSVSVRGNGTIVMQNGDRISLDYYPCAIAFESAFVAQIQAVQTNALLSIENLTTFNSLPFMFDGIVVFTSGYPCQVVIDFMQKVICDNNLDFVWHFGDLDAYGFKILRDIDSKLLAKVLPSCMSIDDYLSHQKHAIKMTKGNEKEFIKMLDDSYYTDSDKLLFRQLLADGVTLEQEGFCVS